MGPPKRQALLFGRLLPGWLERSKWTETSELGWNLTYPDATRLTLRSGTGPYPNPWVRGPDLLTNPGFEGPVGLFGASGRVMFSSDGDGFPPQWTLRDMGLIRSGAGRVTTTHARRNRSSVTVRVPSSEPRTEDHAVEASIKGMVKLCQIEKL